MESFQTDFRHMEACLLYFVGKAYGLGMSPTGMSKKFSALAFWFKSRAEPDVTKIFSMGQAMKGFRRGSKTRDALG